MSTRIVTLFGEEIVPESPKPVAKKTGKKGDEELAPQDPETITAPGPELFVAESAEDVAIAPPLSAAVMGESALPTIAETTTETDAIVAVANETESLVLAAENTETLTGPAIPEAPVEASETDVEDTISAIDNEEANIIPEDWQGTKNYYTIGEVAAFFSVRTSNIRFWTNEFKMKVRTTRKGDRLYTPDQVREMRTIYHLVKERGYTLNGAKTRLKTKNKQEVAAVDLRTSLLQLREKLVILRNRIES